MNQQACLFVEDQKSLQDLCTSDLASVLNFSNKFRGFIFILKDNYGSMVDFEESVNENTVLSLNELLTQFLTYSLEKDDPINHPIVIETATRYWIQDIDIFVGLPLAIEKKLSNLSPHIYFYDDLKLADRLK